MMSLSLRPIPEAARRPAAGSVRLTRRGRVALVVLVVALLLVAFSLGRAASSSAAGPGAPAAPLAQTTVQPGDTLWSVAGRIAPHNDPRQVVEQIRELNHLPGAQLEVGQQLLLPRPA